MSVSKATVARINRLESGSMERVISSKGTSTLRRADRYGAWIGNCILIAGAVALTVSPAIAATYWIFLVFATGHLIWVAISLGRADMSLLALNGTLLVLDVYGVFVRY